MNPVIVAGMHRSGTSAVARLVQQLGLDVGGNLLAATDGNKFGHFEEAAFIRFHDALIARLFPKRAPFCEWLPLTAGDVVYTDEDRREAKSIWEAHRAAGGMAWKDPRTSLFLDLWTEILPDAKVIICLRHPYQVHRSLLRRGEPFLHVDYGAAIGGLTIYNNRILEVISAWPKDRFVVVDVESAFRHPRESSEALARFLGTPLPLNAAEAIAPGEFHFEEDLQVALQGFESFLPAAGATYRRLREMDLISPAEVEAKTSQPAISRGSDEVRLIEFEESHGLRAQAKKMLIRSVAVDRQRTTDFYQHVAKASHEKDLLIQDLSRLTEHLKHRIAELERTSA
jgi:hypothetical protein